MLRDNSEAVERPWSRPRRCWLLYVCWPRGRYDDASAARPVELMTSPRARPSPSRSCRAGAEGPVRPCGKRSWAKPTRASQDLPAQGPSSSFTFPRTWWVWSPSAPPRHSAAKGWLASQLAFAKPLCFLSLTS